MSLRIELAVSLVAASFVIVGCTPPPNPLAVSVAGRVDQFNRDRTAAPATLSQVEGDIAEQLNAIRQLPNGQCDGGPWTNVDMNTGTLESIARTWDVRAVDPLYPIYARTQSLAISSQAKRSAVTARLNTADAALAKRCYDNAENGYRAVVTEYVGSAYTAYRERALLGVQDVQRARLARP